MNNLEKALKKQSEKLDQLELKEKNIFREVNQSIVNLCNNILKNTDDYKFKNTAFNVEGNSITFNFSINDIDFMYIKTGKKQVIAVNQFINNNSDSYFAVIETNRIHEKSIFNKINKLVNKLNDEELKDFLSICK